MTEPFGRNDDEPLVVVVGAPFPPDPALQELLGNVDSGVEVHFSPYNESRDARAARGANNGILPDHVETPDLDDSARELWRRAHVLIGLDVPPDAEELMENLRWFQTISAGTDHIDRAQLSRMGVRLSSASGIASASIAEFVMARLLQIWKRFPELDEAQRGRTWREGAFGSEVTGRTVIIAGLGSIGREVAHRARAFGMDVIATRGSARPGDTDPDVDELHPARELATLLPRADAVVCALPTSPATTDLFDAQMFRAMRPDAVFCNVGRGTLVVEEDLIEVLEDGHLKAAVLDVMRTEPLPDDDPLWTAPRVLLSPHVAVSLDRYQQNAWKILADNLARFLAGERLDNEVDLVG